MYIIRMATTTNCEAMPTYDIKILIAREIGAVILGLPRDAWNGSSGKLPH